MSAFNFDQLIDRTQSSSEKWQKYAGTDVLPMWVADTDFQSPPAVIEALTQRIEHGIFGYTETPDSLNAVFIERMQRMYSWSLATEQLNWLRCYSNANLSPLHVSTSTIAARLS